jgi:hypothetical protein
MDYYIFLIKINYIPLILLLERLVAKNIVGLHNTNGGDLAFAKDGTLFMCTFSGLYRLQLDQANVYQKYKNADNLPFSLHQ